VLLGATLHVRVHAGTDAHTHLASGALLLHGLYHATASVAGWTIPLTHPTTGATVATVTGTLSLPGWPRLAQMVGGLRTEGGIAGASPVAVGAPLPGGTTPDSVVWGVGGLLPQGWAALIDSFGYRCWVSALGGRYCWVAPTASAAGGGGGGGGGGGTSTSGGGGGGDGGDGEDRLPLGWTAEVRAGMTVYVEAGPAGRATWIHPRASRFIADDGGGGAGAAAAYGVGGGGGGRGGGRDASGAGVWGRGGEVVRLALSPSLQERLARTGRPPSPPVVTASGPEAEGVSEVDGVRRKPPLAPLSTDPPVGGGGDTSAASGFGEDDTADSVAVAMAAAASERATDGAPVEVPATAAGAGVRLKDTGGGGNKRDVLKDGSDPVDGGGGATAAAAPPQPPALQGAFGVSPAIDDGALPTRRRSRSLPPAPPSPPALDLPSTTPLTTSDGSIATEMRWVHMDAPPPADGALAAVAPSSATAVTAATAAAAAAASTAAAGGVPSAGALVSGAAGVATAVFAAAAAPLTTSPTPAAARPPGASFLTPTPLPVPGSGWSGTPTEGHTLLAVDVPACGAAGGRTIFKFGGRDAAGGWHNDLYAYRPATASWAWLSPVGAPPCGRTGHAAAMLAGGRMVVFGGATRSGRVADLHMLDTGRLAWTPLSSGAPVAAAAAGDAAAHPPSLVATWHGGRGGGASAAAAAGGPAGAAATPPARARTAMVATQSGMSAVLFGGRSGYTYMGDRYFNDLHLFDGVRGGWLPLIPAAASPAPGRRAGHVSHLVNDRAVLVHGGLLDSACSYADTWLFDLVSGHWVRPPYADGPDAPLAREGHASAALPGSIVVFGGAANNGMYLNDVAVLDTGTLRWAAGGVVARGATPVGRTGAALAPIDDRRLLLVGGETGWSIEGGRGVVLDTAYASMAEMRELMAAAVGRGGGAEACVVCLTAPVDTVFLWCAHYVCCWACAKRVMPTCPLCRGHVFKAQRVFKR